MNTRSLAPPAAVLAAALAVIAIMALLLISAVTAQAQTGSSSHQVSSSFSASSVPITLTKVPPGPIAHASSGYVHLANCQGALAGANGDNDIQAWLNSHTPYGINGWGFDGWYRWRGDRIMAAITMYRNGERLMNIGGYCMGDDSDIVDRAGDPPAGF